MTFSDPYRTIIVEPVTVPNAPRPAERPPPDAPLSPGPAPRPAKKPARTRARRAAPLDRAALMRAPRYGPTPAGPIVYVPGRLYGVRNWCLATDNEGELRLSGMNQVLWQRDGKSTAAVCSHGDMHRAPAPVGGCCCGLYAVHPWAAPGDVPGLASSAGALGVVGIVEAWGTVHVHREGFRAQYARPGALALLGTYRGSGYGELVARLAREHRVELAEFRDLSALVDHCVEAGLGLLESTVAKLLAGGDPRKG